MLKEISVEELSMNPMTLIGKEWWLVTAGNKENGYNTMTASWGHLGALWNYQQKRSFPTAIIFIRPQRYTKQFVEREDIFTLSVFDSKYKNALGYLGSHSGRDEDKVAKVGITPVFADDTTYFNEARLVFICKKIYHAPILETGFVDKSLVDINYPQKDFHEMYVGEIIKVLAK